jgi:Predicted transcriptional regulators
MEIIINNSSMEPIYEQITGQIKAQIVNGSLREETLLPSVRSLSGSLKISALTVKKAYDCLEREGFIVTVHGKGSFVARNNKNLLLEEQRRMVEEKLETAIRAGRNCGMQDDEIRELFDLMMEE